MCQWNAVSWLPLSIYSVNPSCVQKPKSIAGSWYVFGFIFHFMQVKTVSFDKIIDLKIELDTSYNLLVYPFLFRMKLTLLLITILICLQFFIYWVRLTNFHDMDQKTTVGKYKCLKLLSRFIMKVLNEFCPCFSSFRR